MKNSRRPLDGIRVIEVGQLLAGPFAGCMLAYFGAEVIKIEPPEGDPIRGWRVLENGTSHWWRSIGRNKKSITLDLKKPEGQKIARQLIDSADVVIENFRPGVMKRLGLDYESLKKINKKLIYCAITGYGQKSLWKNVAGHDINYMGLSGISFGNLSPALPSDLALSDNSPSGDRRRQCGWHDDDMPLHPAGFHS